MGLLDGLEHVGGFDHAACDASLRAHGIDVGINLSQGGNSALYGGSIIALLWTATIIAVTVRSYRQRRQGTLSPRWRSWVWIGPIFIVFGAFCWVMQAETIVRYITTCRALLHAVGS